MTLVATISYLASAASAMQAAETATFLQEHFGKARAYHLGIARGMLAVGHPMLVMPPVTP